MGIQVHFEPPPIHIIRCDPERNKPKAGFIKVKLRINPTSAISNIKEYKMALFENSEPEELPLFVRYFQNNIKATGSTPAADKIQFLWGGTHRVIKNCKISKFEKDWNTL